jgi:hypothetical protein
VAATVNTLDKLRVRWFDVVHHVDTHAKVRLANLEVTGPNKALGVQYFSTLPKSMHGLFRHLGSGQIQDRTFIDVGCGKGLPLLVASQYPFKKIIGVEFSSELQKRALQNIQEYRGSKLCKDLEVLCMDAAEFAFPAGPLTVYFFNPFQKPVMEQVLKNLALSIQQEQQDVTVVCDTLHDPTLFGAYLNPQESDTFLGFSLYSQLRPELQA